jgi:RND family efflux transporter MFP subunit
VRRLAIPLACLLTLAACDDGDISMQADIAVPVSVEEITLGGIEEFITATGTVYAIKDATLKAEEPGFYRLANSTAMRPFILGDRVTRGQTIIHLDNPEVENNIKIESKKLNLDISRREYEKQVSLYEKGGVTLRELKNAEIAYIEARYTYENAEIQLSKLKIAAPFDGIIVSLPYYTEGTKVETGSTMARILDYLRMYMETSLPGKDQELVAVDQRVRLMNYTLPDDTLDGTLTQMSPAIDPETRSFKVTILIDNPDLRLRPGMFVKAEIIVAARDSAVVIPKDVIMSKRRGKTVFVVKKGAAEERVIVTGLENPDEVEVIEGLEVNERLVVKGFETLRNRSKVKIIR